MGSARQILLLRSALLFAKFPLSVIGLNIKTGLLGFGGQDLPVVLRTLAFEV